MAEESDVLDVVLVGSDEPAQSWLEPLRRSRRLRLAGVVSSDDRLAPEAPLHADLGAAMAAHPRAVFALATPPRAALEGALSLAAAQRRGVVAAPLHDGAALREAALPAGAAAVRVAHGWTTLAGVRHAGVVLARARSGRLAIEIAGLPDAEHGDLDAALLHALALVRSLLPDAEVSSCRRAPGGAVLALEASPDGGRWSVALRVQQHGKRLAVGVASDAIDWRWSCEDGWETALLGGRTVLPRRAVPSAPQRALAQLLGAPPGDSLADAAAVAALARRAAALLPGGVPPSGRALRLSAARAARRPDDVLGRLGLRGALEAAPDEPPAALLDLALPAEPFELWAFRAGIKPVVFLTVAPADVEPVLGHFGDVHCERRERRVSVGAQDRWTDRRDQGEPRVELFISADPALARRAAYLQAEVDPSEAIGELGELVGYPRCCVAAFAAQDDRANNSLNRYHSHGRTLAAEAAASGPPPGRPWPWQLNNLHAVVAPFYPCTYRCERALDWARAALAEMAAAYPEAARRLEDVLARPVLYFDHDHQLVLDGVAAGGRVEYRAVELPHPAPTKFARLAGRIGSGDAFSFDDAALVVERRGEPFLRLARIDPGLGFVAPFGRLGREPSES